jgi:hypothetical protein
VELVGPPHRVSIQMDAPDALLKPRGFPHIDDRHQPTGNDRHPGDDAVVLVGAGRARPGGNSRPKSSRRVRPHCRANPPVRPLSCRSAGSRRSASKPETRPFHLKGATTAASRFARHRESTGETEHKTSRRLRPPLTNPKVRSDDPPSTDSGEPVSGVPAFSRTGSEKPPAPPPCRHSVSGWTLLLRIHGPANGLAVATEHRQLPVLPFGGSPRIPAEPGFCRRMILQNALVGAPQNLSHWQNPPAVVYGLGRVLSSYSAVTVSPSATLSL